MTARERIAALLDPGSFHEYDLFVEHNCKDFGMHEKELAADGVITGSGTIGGRIVRIDAQDFTVAGGSLGLMHARKITKIMDHAVKMGIPVIGINDSGGARIREGVNSLAGYGEIFYHNTMASGIIPQISVILGPCAGGAVYSPALTDFVFVVDQISKMFITGPEVVKTVLGEEISMEELGDPACRWKSQAMPTSLPRVNRSVSIRSAGSSLPSDCNRQRPHSVERKAPTEEYKIENLIPNDSKVPFDMRDIVRALVDGSEFFEIQERFAPNAVIGFSRINGETVGIIGNQAMCWPACWTLMLPTRSRGLSAFVMPSIFRFSRWSIFRATCRAPIRNRRRNPPRRKGALCLQRGDRAQKLR